ncbi:MAG: NAD-dependent epimerase/dehydratase family protein [Phycisphaerales bacterium]
MNTPGTPATPAKRTLVTGGAGFIGSHLVDLLLARGDEVVVVDNLSTGRRENLPTLHPRLRFVHADLSVFLAAEGAGLRFDRAFHLAAAVGVKLVMDEPVRSIETNVGQTAALLEYALTHGPAGGPVPVLIASSSEVYGKSEKCPFAEDDDVVYGPTSKGRWSYAASKAIDEYLALAHHAKHALPVVIARFFNTVGPRQVGEYGMVLPRFVSAAVAGQDLLVHGDGGQSRCLCDVRDVVPAVAALLEAPECRGRVFNVGSDRPISVLDLARRVIAVLSSSSRVRCVPYNEVYSKGFEDLRRREPDLRRIRSAIGFEPRIGLDQTIRDLAASVRS